MPKSRIDRAPLNAVCSRFGDVVIDPAVWPDLMSEVCLAVGARGAILLQADQRTGDVPWTESVADVFRNYFADGWHTRDIRARGAPLLLKGQPVITDEDVVTVEERRRSPFYNEAVFPFGLEWFAAIGFNAGPALWALSIQRTSSEGPFEHADRRLLATLSRPLTEAATLSTALGRMALQSVTDALGAVDHAAAVIDRAGKVMDFNSRAGALFDAHINVRNGRLLIHDQLARQNYDRWVEQLGAHGDAPLMQDPIVVRRGSRSPVVLRILSIPPAARSPFLGARALLTLSEVQARKVLNVDLLKRVFGLTAAETRLAAIVGQGLSLEVASETLGVSRDTVRNQLKSIFAKTSTHRQSELVALIAGL
jgi:DNA-binding CsgD family transcriptional regulator